MFPKGSCLNFIGHNNFCPKKRIFSISKTNQTQMWWGSLTTSLTLKSCSSWVLGKSQALLKLLTMLWGHPTPVVSKQPTEKGPVSVQLLGPKSTTSPKLNLWVPWCFCLKNLFFMKLFLVSSIMTSTSTFKAKIYQILLGKYWHFGTDHSLRSLETPFVSENLLVIQMKRCDNLQEL